MERLELSRIANEELWCEADLRHKKFVYRGARVEYVCDVYVDNLENFDHLYIKHLREELIKGERYYGWIGEYTSLDPTCSICNSSSFKIHYFSSLGGSEKVISVLQKNLSEKDSAMVNRFTNGLLHWISGDIPLNYSPQSNFGRNPSHSFSEKEHREMIYELLSAYGYELNGIHI